MDNPLFMSKRDNWGTPPEIFKTLDDVYHFDVDLCADMRNHKVANWFGLDHPEPSHRSIFDIPSDTHFGSCFINPPYSRQSKHFMRAAMDLSMNGNNTVVALVLSRTDVQWWHDYVMPFACEVSFRRGRIKFIDPDTGRPAASGCPAPSCLVVWSPWHVPPGPPDIVDWTFG